ncbi:tripartite tricarboxylate transporter substrate binding protein [Pseudaminobacter arsenicus]|uniref:Tripartite tricarboxylate transporter substrate binding protein n=1 Tax=Borborobacter arsenicus TaxID=1851146 RepID=A0A432V4H1_9HYPH|nr:tripartite tricarboxylate transporter substrate binding protein [Pseudaminobacter arsenicus]RUM97031.1 tripartite tricarboxylate transporter substrate binding protein [Pseudaminobacter arsenicus]
MHLNERKRGAGFWSAIALGVAMVFSGTAVAQEWAPTKPLRLIVPYPAGGTSDTIARLIAPELGEALGQPVVVENKTGGGGVTGTEAILRSPADGHTFGIIASSYASAVNLVPDLPFDPIKDAQPLTMVTRVGVALITNPDFPAKTLQELLAMAKEKPGTIPYGSAGNGLSGHFSGEAMKLSANVDMVHVPYRGGAPGLNDVIAGQIPMMFNVISSVKSSIDGGKVRPLVVTSAERSKVLPDVPTMAEAGVEDVEIYEWYGLVAPAGIPPEATKRLHAELAKVLKQQAFVERMDAQGVEVVANSPEDFTAFISGEIERFGQLIKSANITLD